MRLKVIVAPLFILMMIAALVLGMVNLALADPGSQKWYFRWTADGYTGTAAADSGDDVATHVGDWIMTKTMGDNNWGVDIYYAGGYYAAWWYAENAADVNLAFGSGDDWTAHIGCSIPGMETQTLYVQLFKVDSSGNYTALTDEYVGTGLPANTSAYHDCTLNGKTDQSISAGERLAVRLMWDQANVIQIEFNGGVGGDYNSYIQSPESDPSYPVPELQTIILLSIGLLGLGGYVLFRRRRQTSILNS